MAYAFANATASAPAGMRIGDDGSFKSMTLALYESAQGFESSCAMERVNADEAIDESFVVLRESVNVGRQ